jgi:ferredoxin
MTNHWVDIKNADVIPVMGGNAAEAHPCGFKWVTEAKAHNKARLIVVDPRFTRTASVADVYAPIRTGTDNVFLGGLINHLDFHEENCIGCGYCITGCPFNIPRISKKDHKAYKCTLCSDRVSVGLEPACIKSCPTGALVFGTKEDMKLHAAERIEDLKSRGFENAGLYDPAGVSGTHVMYVLHHADQPELYNGLPKDPHISPMVRLWKGFAKPLGLAAMALTAVVGFFHYTRVGPDETDSADEAAADEMTRSGTGKAP